MGIVSWWVIPEKDWLSRRQVARVLEATEAEGESKDNEAAELGKVGGVE